MILEDSISLKEITYPFTFTIEDKLEENELNLKKTIDINEFLWQYIVLEVPIRYTEVKDYNEYHGDGWKLISEEELSKEGPLAKLIEEIEEEWYNMADSLEELQTRKRWKNHHALVLDEMTKCLNVGSY